MRYFLYKITNLVNNKFYIGVHSTDDINDDYMGSGKAIKAAVKKYGKENFKKEILEYFNNPVDMYKKEAEIVNENLINNPLCYNIALGGHGLSKMGFCFAENIEGDRILISKQDPRLKSGEYSKLFVVKNNSGHTYFTTKNDPKYISGEYQHNRVGTKFKIPSTQRKVNVIDENGNMFKISVDDYKLNKDKFKHFYKNKVTVKDKNGDTLCVDINDPKYLSGDYKHIATGRAVVKDKNGNICVKNINDPTYLNGDYISIMKGKTIVKDKNGNNLCVAVNDPRYLSGELISINKGRLSKYKNKILVFDKFKNRIWIDNLDDPRFKSGELRFKLRVRLKGTKKIIKMFWDDPRLNNSSLYHIITPRNK